MPVLLGYWNLRGISECIRYLLHYLGVQFEDRKFEIDKTKSKWINEKNNFGLDFPNLPFYIDDEVKLTQTMCIMRYLARKHGLAGNNEDEIRTLDLLEQTAADLIVNLNKMSYRPDFDQLVGPYLEVLQDRLARLSQYLGDKKYLLGERITYVDFYLFEAIDHNRLLKASCLEKFPNLQNYMERIKSLPEISEYINSDDFQVWPIYAEHAKFGGKNGHYPFFK